MNTFPASPAAMLRSAWRHRHLIRQLARREIMGRYKGSLFGIVWSLFTPILMLTIYSFVFSVVFKARWPGGEGSKTEFAILLFVGMIVFNLFSECINRAPGLVVSNPNFVKKVVFPLEIYPWAVLVSALFHASISLVVLFIFTFFNGLSIPATALLLPLALLPLILFSLGLSWFLSALAVFIRDITQTIGLAITVLMFLSPVFYPIEALPTNFQAIASLNPLAFNIESARDLLIWGKLPALDVFIFNLSLGALCAALGFAWFQKTRHGFGDVL